MLAGALLCLLVVVAFAVVYKTDVTGARRLRQRPRRRAAGLDLPAPARLTQLPAGRRGRLRHASPMTIYTAIAAVLLVWRKHVAGRGVDGRA